MKVKERHRASVLLVANHHCVGGAMTQPLVASQEQEVIAIDLSLDEEGCDWLIHQGYPDLKAVDWPMAMLTDHVMVVRVVIGCLGLN